MTSNQNNFVTLKQGKIYKELQKKILDGSQYKGLEKKSKKTIVENLCQRRREGMQNRNVTHKTLNENKEQLLKYTQLQSRFNDLLSQYDSMQKNLMSNVESNINEKTGKNVYVNSVINNPTANYIGAFLSSPSMKYAGGGDILEAKYNYDSCMQEAVKSGNSYFGLNRANASTQSAVCMLGSTLDSARENGAFKDSCIVGSDGKKYGSFSSNGTALYTTSNSVYNGCFISEMENSGIDINKYSPVYSLGKIGIGPWGNNNGFPDPTAEWIWYSPNAQVDAPVNTTSPVTFIYNYMFDGPNYTAATVYVMNDDSGTWYFNSKQVAQVSGGQLISFSVEMQPGMNFLACSAINNSGPAGLIATVIINGNVSFNTNSNWKYTNLPISSMVQNGSNYSVETCQEYAKNNGYIYFGLQGGVKDTSRCLVSNSYEDATKFGSADPIIKFNDGHLYSTYDVNALYEVNNQRSNPEFVGKMGYVVNDSVYTEYPPDMITPLSDKNILPTINGSDSSCPKGVEAIDSVAWGKLKNSGSIMTPSTKCGFEAAIREAKDKVNSLKGQLADIADQMLSIISNLKKTNKNINEQLNIDESTMLKNVKLYESIRSQFGVYKKNNMNSMLMDSTSLIDYESYHYIFWGVLAATIVIITLHTINRE